MQIKETSNFSIITSHIKNRTFAINYTFINIVCIIKKYSMFICIIKKI